MLRHTARIDRTNGFDFGPIPTSAQRVHFAEIGFECDQRRRRRVMRNWDFTSAKTTIEHERTDHLHSAIARMNETRQPIAMGTHRPRDGVINVLVNSQL